MEDRVSETRPDGALVRPRTKEGSRAYDAYVARQSGLSWDEVAEAVGYENSNTAKVNVNRFVQKAGLEADRTRREEALMMELDRLDRLQYACWGQAMTGDLKAIETALRVINTRARILGLDQVSLTQTVTHNTVVVQGGEKEFVDSLKVIAGEAS